MVCEVLPEAVGPFVLGKRLRGKSKDHAQCKSILVICDRRAVSGVVSYDTELGIIVRYVEGPSPGEVLFDLASEQFITEEITGNVEAYALEYKRGLTL